MKCLKPSVRSSTHATNWDAELGRGSVGAVYRAHDTLLDRHVAVKVVSTPELGTESRFRLD